MTVMVTQAELEAFVSQANAKKKKPSKHKNKRFKDPDGGNFFWDSKLEYKHHCELRLRQELGEIRDLARQHRFYFWVGVPTPEDIGWYANLKRPVAPNALPAMAGRIAPLPKRFAYVVDHVFWDVKRMCWRYQDTKGERTSMFILKKQLIEQAYGIEIEELTR